ncbi:MAG: hypothetical protein U9P79_06880 [Candidatus Cloacimonadota bacterium]|nr:hypothetical protein [Candidatus Cloacimonadota bacterium]
MGAIVIPLLYYFVVRNQLIAIAILLPIALICLIIDASRIENPRLKNKFYSLFGAHLRDEETSRLTGASYLLTSSVVAIAIFTKEIAFLSISFLAIGDTFAALIGLQFGKRKIGNSKKTLEGLIGSFISCAIFGIICYFLIFEKVFAGPQGTTNPEPYTIMILAGAITAAITEVSNLHINDNITIPLISGIVMSIIFMII